MKKSSPFKRNKIRIIAGKWKGRKISISRHSSIRPTTSYIRETLFNWINPVIHNSTCLDCFAGSGALGLESLSRGAKHVTFIDHNYICILTLKKNIQSFQNNANTIIHADCCQWLRKSKETYNLIFIDPPFKNFTIIPKIIFLLEKYNHCTQQAWIYIETAKYQNNVYNTYTNKLPKYWSLYKSKTTQSISATLYFRNQQ